MINKTIVLNSHMAKICRQQLKLMKGFQGHCNVQETLNICGDDKVLVLINEHLKSK